MSLYMDTNTRETDHIGMEIIYKVDITNYINRSKELKEKIRKSYTVIW